MRYRGHVPRALHARLDDSSAAALDLLKAEGLTESQAVRRALQEAAARRRRRAHLVAEAAALAADPADRLEARAVMDLMDELAPDDAA